MAVTCVKSLTSPNKSAFFIKNGYPSTTLDISVNSIENSLNNKKRNFFSSLTDIAYYLLLYTTSPTSIHKTEATVDTLHLPKKIEAVLTFYSLSKTHLSRILGISRPALYAWIDETAEAEFKNTKKLDELYEISKELSPNLNQSIYKGFVERPFNGFEKSLLSVFSEMPSLNCSEVKIHVKKAFEKSAQRLNNITSRRSKEFKHTLGDAEKELILEDNLLG